MSEERENSNIWEDALDKVNTPPLPDSWKAMEGLLDDKMPPPRNNRYWSWLLGLLLLLLIGVCYFRPSSGNHLPVHTAASLATGSASPATGPVSPATGPASSAAGRAPSDDGTPASPAGAVPSTSGSVSSATGNAAPNSGSIASVNSATAPMASATTTSAAHSATGKPVSIPGSGVTSANQISTPGSETAAATSSSGVLTTGSNKSKSGQKHTVKPHAGADAATASSANAATASNANAATASNANAANPSGTDKANPTGSDKSNSTSSSDTASIAGSVGSKAGPASNPKAGAAGNVKADSAGSTAAANAKTKATGKSANKPASSKETAHKHGFAVGVGLNQFFALGDQSKSNLNADGTTGTLSDYLPVPEVRYYFRPELYVQLEAQFNSPQYTKPNLVASQNVVHDTFNNAIQPYTATSVYIQKLYYFNLPLSIHYSPIKHLFLGAGIEYAKMTNGVALFQQYTSSSDPTGTGYNPNLSDTIHYSKLQSFKGDSIYKTLNTQEFRVLFDASFQWKAFTLGLRYNQALERFINVQISSSQVTQARNSSLQLYLRYTLWRQKTLKPYEW